MSTDAMRIRRLEDLESIRQLTADYGNCVDEGWNGKVIDVERLVDLFTEDASWRSAETDVDASGRPAILEMFDRQRASPNPRFTMHNFSDDHASSLWMLWVVIVEGPHAKQYFNTVDVAYARTPSGWRISAIDLHIGRVIATPLSAPSRGGS